MIEERIASDPQGSACPLLPGFNQLMTDQALFFWRVFLRQRDGLRAMASGASGFNPGPGGAFLHRFIEWPVQIIKRDSPGFLLGCAHDERSEDENNGGNDQEISL